MRAASILLSGLLMTTPALLQASAPRIKIVGLGATQCAEFADRVAAGPEAERTYFAWAQGFMSGLLIRAPGGVDEALDLMPATLPLGAQADFLRLYCEREPDSGYMEAVLALIKSCVPCASGSRQCVRAHAQHGCTRAFEP